MKIQNWTRKGLDTKSDSMKTTYDVMGLSRRDFLLSTASAGMLLATGLKPAAAATPTLDEQRIQALFDKAVERSGTVGAQLSIIKDGQQFDFVAGLANAELNIPMTQDTIGQIGSTTKIFNAMLVMSLVEEGRLDLDTPVASYLPSFSVADPVATRVITLRQLHSMSSGLDNGDYAEHGPGEDALARRIASLKTLPQAFVPGSAFGYSNAGTDIAGYVAERVSGTFWDDLLMERILEPAGLKNAASRARDLVYQRVAVGHRLDPRGGAPTVTRPWSISRGLAPAGATLNMSAHDLVRFGKIFLDHGVADTGNRILSKRAIQTMMTPQIETQSRMYAQSWCIGPHKSEWDGVELWGHPGGNISGLSYLHWIPERNAAIAHTLNTGEAFGRFSKVMFEELTEVAFGMTKPKMVAPSPPLAIANAERYVGTYESLGVSREVVAAGERLRMTTIRSGIDEGDTVSLVPLGGDRFLLDAGEASDPLALPVDTAFFGDDGNGRALNMLNGVFPLRRKT